jgi:glycine/D-amino acid oxidase-like deaminating enzyme
MRPFWLEQALQTETCETCPALQGDMRTDVCIVGGGYTGLWTAIMLKQNPGLEVVLIEADICGAGASGRNGGCALSWSAKYFTLERLFGVEERCGWSRNPSAASTPSAPSANSTASTPITASMARSTPPPTVRRSARPTR